MISCGHGGLANWLGHYMGTWVHKDMVNGNNACIICNSLVVTVGSFKCIFVSIRV